MRARAGSNGGGRGQGSERVLALCLLAFPSDYRAEHGAELVRDYAQLRRESSTGRGRGEAPGAKAAGGARGTGAVLGAVLGAARGWWRVLADLARSAPRERLAAWRQGRAARARADRYRPPYREAVLAALAVWVLYCLTLAPSIGFWDSGEYVTVAHTLGIPHPPGNPLFVLLAHGWESLLAGTGLPVALRINLLSASASALAHGFWFLVADRLLAGAGADRWARRLGAACAVALSATAYSVWSQSNVNEKVYTLSLLSTAALVWLALRWRDTGRSTAPLVLGAFVLALTATNHLMGLLAAPALLAFVLLVEPRALARPRFWGMALPLVALALSVQLFLPLRAAQRPVIGEGDPRCDSAASAVASVASWGHAGCTRLSAVLQREQYPKPALSLDPTVYPEARLPRGPALLASQLVNWGQYFDWQWARSVAGQRPAFGGARPLFTLVVLALGLLGALTVRRRDGAAAVLLGLLFLTLSAGLVFYLNFKYGWSLERTRFPDPSMHEVRERDYFFLIGFSLWGVFAGLGLAELWRLAGARLGRLLASTRVRAQRPLAPARAGRLLAAPLLALALVPLALNWSWASRAGDWTARDWAYNVLMSVEPYGVLVTNGDNDSFPLWYAQNVEGIRTDVSVVLMPYMQTAWYAREVRDLSRPCPAGVDPERTPTRVVCQRPFHPERLPQVLARSGGAPPPEDSILPLGDADIERIAGSGFVTREALSFSAGGLRGTIAAGTSIEPSDTFVAVMLRSTLGHRPIHFMTPAPVLDKLGLGAYTIRQGLTWKLDDGADAGSRGDRGDRVVALPPGPLTAAFGAYVDVTRGDTLANEVWLRRGRVAQPGAPWVDAANGSIPMNYAYALLALAQAHAQLGETDTARAYAARAAEWARLGGSGETGASGS